MYTWFIIPQIVNDFFIQIINSWRKTKIFFRLYCYLEWNRDLFHKCRGKQTMLIKWTRIIRLLMLLYVNVWMSEFTRYSSSERQTESSWKIKSCLKNIKYLGNVWKFIISLQFSINVFCYILIVWIYWATIQKYSRKYSTSTNIQSYNFTMFEFIELKKVSFSRYFNCKYLLRVFKINCSTRDRDIVFNCSQRKNRCKII